MASSIIKNNIKIISITTPSIDASSEYILSFSEYVTEPLKGVCLYSWLPENTYGTRPDIHEINIENKIIKFHTSGDTKQSYILNLLIFY